VAKHLFDDLDGDTGPTATPARGPGAVLAPGERAPYDPDAT
jgi:hypothetical protein